MERRLAAILAADVVGYSRLMGADEAGTLAAMRTLRKDTLEPLSRLSMARAGACKCAPIFSLSLP